MIGDSIFWRVLALGAVVFGIRLPGSLLIFMVGAVFRAHGDHAWATSTLKKGSCHLGRIGSLHVVHLSKRSPERFGYVFGVLTVLAVNRLH